MPLAVYAQAEDRVNSSLTMKCRHCVASRSGSVTDASWNIQKAMNRDAQCSEKWMFCHNPFMIRSGMKLLKKQKKRIMLSM